jgi:hypothetical protein
MSYMEPFWKWSWSQRSELIFRAWAMDSGPPSQVVALRATRSFGVGDFYE